MIFDGSDEQGRLILRAMAQVSRADTGKLTIIDRGALVSAAALVFGLGGPLDVDSLHPISPQELADGLGERGAEAIVPLIVMATVDGKVSPSAADLVGQYASALGVEEPAVTDLQELVRGQLAAARADMLRRNRVSITGDWVEDTSTYGDWLFPYRASPAPEITQRYEALADRPVGSFGKVFHDFYIDNGFGFAGQQEAAAESFTTPHDSAHVLSGYDTSVQGELLVSTYTAGMHVIEGLAGHILPVIVSWHLGVPLSDLAGSASGALDARKFWVAWERGDATVGDTFDADWNFWEQTGRPLDDVRAEMAVPPLSAEDAADGMYPDWYEPTA